MDRTQQVLSDIVIYNKYAKYNKSQGRRETWDEICNRYLEVLLKKYCTDGDYTNWLYYKDKKEDFTWYKFLSPLAIELLQNMHYVREKKVLMSMRMAQFAGQAVEKNHTRGYNCAFLPIDHPAAFSETMFLLLGGTGVGYSVQNTHVNQLPEINKGDKDAKFLVNDSIEGWADAIKALMYWGLGKRKYKPRFDYSDIRPKGARLVTAGGKAPGPAPLRICIAKIESILENKINGSKLTSLEVHDILCHIADAVLAGGIRRAAMIALFSADDEDMITCKSGVTVSLNVLKEGEDFINGIATTGKGEVAEIWLDKDSTAEYRATGKVGWFWFNPQRGRANNSAVLLRHRVTKEFFLKLWKQIEDSNAGEPGIYFSNDLNWGTNPCCEIALRAFQFCNLTEINAGSIIDSIVARKSGMSLVEYSHRNEQDWLEEQEELNNRARVAAFFGTLQAGFTDFHYLRPIWRQTTEKDALIGVGITGICNGDILPLDLTKAANEAITENKRVAAIIKINSAARVTTVKPSGTTSCVVGTSSGIHAWHSKYYIRNMQCAVGDDLYNFFSLHHPELITIMEYDPKSAVIGIPQRAPDHAVLREDENAIQMLERVFKFYDEWVKVGHQSGSNTNNVSATVYIDKDKKYAFAEYSSATGYKAPGFDQIAVEQLIEMEKTHGKPVGYSEWEAVGEELWNNRKKFNGMSVLPYNGGSYKNAPFQECTEEEFNEKYKLLDNIDLTKILEEEDNTTQAAEAACAGAGCEI